jgi:hypothetical protein
LSSPTYASNAMAVWETDRITGVGRWKRRIVECELVYGRCDPSS